MALLPIHITRVSWTMTSENVWRKGQAPSSHRYLNCDGNGQGRPISASSNGKGHSFSSPISTTSQKKAVLYGGISKEGVIIGMRCMLYIPCIVVVRRRRCSDEAHVASSILSFTNKSHSFSFSKCPLTTCLNHSGTHLRALTIPFYFIQTVLRRGLVPALRCIPTASQS